MMCKPPEIRHNIQGKGVLLSMLLLLLGTLLASCGGRTTAGTGPTAAPVTGAQIDPPRQLTDFTMTSDTGTPLSLSDLRGKPVLLYFGYTFCPDVCPTTLADFVRVKRNLGDAADDVAFVFISVDPERDTPEKIATYMQAFDDDFIGLHADEKTLRKIQYDYGLYYQKSRVAGTSAAYLVDHSTGIYLIDQEGRLTFIYAFGTPADVITTDVRTLLDAG